MECYVFIYISLLLLAVKSNEMVLWKIVPRLTNKNVIDVPLETSSAFSASLCGYKCSVSSTCRLFQFNDNNGTCGLFTSVNHREAGYEWGNRFYQMMPNDCISGIDEWFPSQQLCLWVHSAPLPYDQAAAACQSLHRELMGVEDDGKNTLTRNIMGLINTKYSFVYSKRVTSTTYEWSSGAPVNQFWCSGQPFEYDDCVGMDLSLNSYCPAGGLDDTSCSSPRPFICI